MTSRTHDPGPTPPAPPTPAAPGRAGGSGVDGAFGSLWPDRGVPAGEACCWPASASGSSPG